MPIRVLVTGDTHLGARRDWLPKHLVDALAGVDLVIHTGDFGAERAVDLFRSRAPLLAVSGNNDAGTTLDTFPGCLKLKAAEKEVIVTHGHRERGRSARDAVFKAYAGYTDLVIYGHSHRARWEEVDSTWFLNPGSPTNKRWEPRFSFAILEIDKRGTFQAQIEYFDGQVRPEGS